MEESKQYCANGNPQQQWMDRDEVSSPTVTTEVNQKLFKVNVKSPKLSKENKELFHTVTAKGLFACK